VLAANRGVPLILSEPGAPFTQKVLSFAKALTAQIGRAERVSA